RAQGDVDGAFEHPHLLVHAHVARPRLEGDATAGGKMDLHDLHWLGGAGGGDVAAKITGRRVAPQRLYGAPAHPPPGRGPPGGGARQTASPASPPAPPRASPAPPRWGCSRHAR